MASEAAKTPKGTRDNRVHEGTTAKPDMGPRAAPKRKPKPYTIRYLTSEETRALKFEAEDGAPENQMTTEATTNERTAGGMPDTVEKAGTTEGKRPADTGHEAKGPEEPKVPRQGHGKPDTSEPGTKPDNQPGQLEQTGPSQTSGPNQDGPAQTTIEDELFILSNSN